MKTIALSTSDNPYSPIKDFDRWLEFDNEKGYNTCGYLARIAMTSPEFEDDINEQLIVEAIDDICKHNILGLVTNGEIAYIKVSE